MLTAAEREARNAARRGNRADEISKRNVKRRGKRQEENQQRRRQNEQKRADHIIAVTDRLTNAAQKRFAILEEQALESQSTLSKYKTEGESCFSLFAVMPAQIT